jgi:hypothetical protein
MSFIELTPDTIFRKLANRVPCSLVAQIALTYILPKDQRDLLIRDIDPVFAQSLCDSTSSGTEWNLSYQLVCILRLFRYQMICSITSPK